VATDGAALDDFGQLWAHPQELHPVRYGALVTGVRTLFLPGVRPVVDQSMAMRLVVLADRLYDRDVPALSSGVPLDELFPTDLLNGGSARDTSGPCPGWWRWPARARRQPRRATVWPNRKPRGSAVPAGPHHQPADRGEYAPARRLQRVHRRRVHAGSRPRERPACPVTRPGAKDPEWIPVVAARGWLIVTRDKRMQDNRAEIEAVRTHGAKMINFASGDAGDDLDAARSVHAAMAGD
jgi:hypothetical protein